MTEPEAFPPESRPCPVCGSREKSLLWSQRFRRIAGGSLLSGYDVVICAACGMGFADGLPSQESFDIYYREMSKYEAPPGDKPLTAFDQRRYRETAAVVAGLASDRGARILDVGCATGGLLESLRREGYDHVLGLDPSPACAEAARRLRGITVVTGALGSHPAALGTFDLVILASVLEHIGDLAGTFRKARELVNPGGLLYVEVPDATRFSCSARTPPFQEFSIEHINYFSTVSLANMMSVNGFREVLSRQTGMEQNPGVYLHDIKAAFRREEGTGELLGRDLATEKALRSYLAASIEADRKIAAVVDGLLASRRPLLVWGAGTMTQRLLAAGRLVEADIRAFVDSNPRYQGKILAGAPIIAPEALRGRPETILISTLVFREEIERIIRDELGLENEVVTFPDLDGEPRKS